MNSDFAKRSPVTVAERPYPFPSRTRKSSSPAPKILRGQLLGKIGRRRALWRPGAFFPASFNPRLFRYPPNMEAQQFTPCPWLLDDAGAIEPGRPRVPSRCGADPARGELSNQIRERRCLTGSACEIRDAREAALGPLAATLAPGQPVGDAALLYGDEPAQPRASRPWGRLLLVAALAALLVIGGGPLAGAVGPAIDSLIGAADASAEPSAAPSDSALPTATPVPSATPTATPSPSPTPSPTPTATPAPSSDSGTTYVVKRGDRPLCRICLQLADRWTAAWKAIAELERDSRTPDYDDQALARC